MGGRTGILVLLPGFVVAGVICYPVSACTTVWIKLLTANLLVDAVIGADLDPTGVLDHVELELRAVACTLDIVGMLLHRGDLVAQRFDRTLGVAESLSDGEDLGRLERALVAFVISGSQSVGIESLG